MYIQVASMGVYQYDIFKIWLNIQTMEISCDSIWCGIAVEHGWMTVTEQYMHHTVAKWLGKCYTFKKLHPCWFKQSPTSYSFICGVVTLVTPISGDSVFVS